MKSKRRLLTIIAIATIFTFSSTVALADRGMAPEPVRDVAALSMPYYTEF